MEYFIFLQNVGNVDVTNILVPEFLEPWFTFIGSNVTPETVVRALDGFPNSDMKAEYDAVVIWKVPLLSPGEYQVISYKALLDRTLPIGTLVRGTACATRVTQEELLACTEVLLVCLASVYIGCAAAGPGYPGCVAAGIAGCQAAFLVCMAFALDCDENSQTTTAPRDPNEKLVVAKRFIQPDQTLFYPIHFENVGDIEALDVFVTDVLDPNLDPSTLEILTPGATYDGASGAVKWNLLGINLPPQEGDNVLLSIKPMPGLPSGTEIRNKASIQFEVFETIETNEVVNIIDGVAPVATMSPVPDTTNTAVFTISWSGIDAVGEIESYSVSVSVDGGEFQPFLTNTVETTAQFTGECGKSYAFFSKAIDTAGNVEAQEFVAEEFTTIVCGAKDDRDDDDRDDNEDDHDDDDDRDEGEDDLDDDKNDRNDNEDDHDDDEDDCDNDEDDHHDDGEDLDNDEDDRGDDEDD